MYYETKSNKDFASIHYFLKELLIMGCFEGNGCCWIIILLIIVFFCCGNGNAISGNGCGNGCGCANDGCGCGC